MTSSMDAPRSLEREITLFESLKGSTDTYPQRMARFAPNGAFFVSTDGKDLRIWRRDEHQHAILHRVVETVTHTVAISHDSQIIASLEPRRVFQNHIYLWSPDGELIADLTHRGEECQLAFSPVTSHLIVADDSGHLQWWDTERMTLLCESDLPPETTPSPFNNTVRELAFTPDGRRLAAQWSTKQGAVQVWELETPGDRVLPHFFRWKGSVASSMLANRSLLTGLAYSPDWQYLAVASEQECCVRLFDAYTLDEVGAFEIPRTTWGPAALAFSPDGTYLAIAGCDGTLWIGEVSSQHLRGLIHAHVSEARSAGTVLSSLDWSSDGKWILTTGAGMRQEKKVHEGKIVVFEVPDYTVNLWKVKPKAL